MKKSNWSDWIYKVFKVIDELISVELFHPSLRVSSTRSAATGRDSQSTPKRRPASRMQMSRPRWPFWRNSHSGGASCFRMTTNSPLPIPAVWSNLPTKKKNTTIPLNFIQLNLFGFNSIYFYYFFSDLIQLNLIYFYLIRFIFFWFIFIFFWFIFIFFWFNSIYFYLIRFNVIWMTLIESESVGQDLDQVGVNCIKSNWNQGGPEHGTSIWYQ